MSCALCAIVQQHEEKAFLSFMRTNHLLYTGDEYHFRLGVYLTNARRVQEFNAQKRSFTVALNKFACLTRSEYLSMLGAKRVSKTHANTKVVKASKKAAPDAIDWRDSGIVNPIKDQGQCGSCWAFSAIQVQESQYALVFGTLQSLSEQNIVDCVTDCYGCDGGWPSSALDYVIRKQSGKFMLEDDYPYLAVAGKCQFDASKAVQVVTGYVDVKAGSEDDLKEKVGTLGVASICIDASSWDFQLYSGGIYDEPDCSSWWLDHAVGCVGYGTENGTDYWIVRNSWGTDWGEDGYIRMIRNKGDQCGEAEEALVATVQ